MDCNCPGKKLPGYAVCHTVKCIKAAVNRYKWFNAQGGNGRGVASSDEWRAVYNLLNDAKQVHILQM